MPIFDDLLTSYRGAGVIGTLMGIFVLGGFILLSMFAFDPQYNGSMQSIDSVIAGQVREIGVLEEQLADAKQSYLIHLAEKGRQSGLEAQLQKNGEKKEKLEKLAKLRERVKEASTKIDAKVADYVRSYRDQIRKEATGEIIPKIVVSGRLIENATISQVTPAGIHVMHEEGIARIPANQLPEELRVRFQFDESEMAGFLERERAQLEQMEETIDAGVEDFTKSERIKYLDRRSATLSEQLGTARVNLMTLRRQRRPDARAIESATRRIKETEAQLDKLEQELATLRKGKAKKEKAEE
jgi:hypothetical protein